MQATLEAAGCPGEERVNADLTPVKYLFNHGSVDVTQNGHP